MSRRNRKKVRSLEFQVSHNYEEMMQTVLEYHVLHKQLYCGYLRQPIYTIKKYKSIEIYGKCALTNKDCIDTVRPVELCYQCEIYKKHFNLL